MRPTLGISLADTRGGSAPFTPLSISSLRMWLDPTDSDTVTLTGSTIIQIDDKSGYANHQTQNLTRPRPTLDSGVANGLDAEYYSGSGTPPPQAKFLQATPPTGFTEAEIFYVLKVDSATPAANKGLHTLYNAGGNQYPLATGNITLNFGSTATKYSGAPPITLTDWHILNMRSTASGWRARFNGGNDIDVSPNTVGFGASHLFGTNATGAGFAGHKAQTLVFNAALSDADNLSVHEFLANLFGITLV